MGAIRNNYKSFEQLRRLRDGEIVGEEPALVLADENIVLTLPRLLGKAFYKTPRSTPISIKISPSTVSKVVDEAFNKSYIRKNAGNCVAVRIGYAGMSVEELVENCIAIWDRCVNQQKLVKTGIQDVRSVFIKSGSSVALPVWMADELYSQEDVLEEPVVKSVKAKTKTKKAKPANVEKPTAAKRNRDTQDDDVEKSFEEKRARKLAKMEKSKGTASIKA
jgi:ribosome biogenesis protein UTP30